ncbi:MAG: hypothetical protein AUJ92_00935 [Armatimonadetes bacterium CG2_30_59_28]|nr:NAD(+)/NADH kinase [Armatimonadota bacterium]OIO98666.1 MAG: hypothetical protein AUJ92_00935 [Armatimonadetes bacterium CG2_30_59_28]PIU61015.1 MAG: NAD(+) kinase [Armatimonadetes bacterium CG07_land_8_20_14_0_80_59_28]PIY43538.1 MAG: NAD(+) kinase [Armatimonadetes bacterium CG_4_10_14_3_um_filter_59_10]
MKSVGVVVAPHIDQAMETARHLLAWLASHSIAPLIVPDAAAALQREDLSASIESMTNVDCAIVLGGDGSVLATARELAPCGVPLLAVDLGEVGFLSEVQPESLFLSLDKLTRDDFEIDERLMVGVAVIREGQEVSRSLALNDAVISRGTISRMLHLHCEINRRFVSDYPADGLIVSTPTGSTAYSLSAGGPILQPNLRALLITPICAHTLFTRPVVVSSEDSIRVSLRWSRGRAEEVRLTVDGQVNIQLYPGDEVILSAAEKPARLIRLCRHDFYERLRQKLSWGGER